MKFSKEYENMIKTTTAPHVKIKREQFSNPSIEAQIANIADEITYYSHDLDDGLDHKLINEQQLNEVTLWQKCSESVEENFQD